MICELLSRSASADPDRPAIVMDGRTTSFRQLEAMSDAVCGHLQEMGLRAGGRIIVMLDNGPECAAVFFGIAKAGGVAVPLNPANTLAAVRYVAEHCSAGFAVAAERAVNYFQGWWKGAPIVSGSISDGRGISLRGFTGCDSPTPRSCRPAGRPEDLAMVLYTSGTTGSPKGVMLSHANIESNTRSILAYLPLDRDERTLSILPFYYSYGNSLLMTHVCVGAALVVENEFAYVNKALATMREQRVTGFSGVPSHFSILLKRSRFLEMPWPDLRYMTCAGGKLPADHIQRLRAVLPKVQLHVMYGQTEASARISSLDPSLVGTKTESVGKGIPGVEVRVVDGRGREVAPDEVGEVVARGANIMMGYLDDPVGTAEVVKEGWLHTGDLAVIDDEGFIYIRGRNKEFIKTGGYRIGPHQVEDVLARHPAVVECAVAGVADELLGEKVAAFIVLRGGSDAASEVESLTKLAREMLPPYMVPAVITPVDAIPKTDSGKIKRTSLREGVRSTISGNNAPRASSRT